MKFAVLPSQREQLIQGLFNAPAKTFYEHSYDKWLGSYKVTWKAKGKEYVLKTTLRFMDFEGYRPKLSSVRYIVPLLRTYFESRKNYILQNPLPFLVFEAIHKMDKLLSPGDKILEFGSGNSTLWFLRKKCNLISFEHSEIWSCEVKKHVESVQFDQKVKDRFSYHICEKEATWALTEALKDQSFDMILVDGSNDFNNRNECIKRSLPKLKKGGWMVLDNSDHPNNWPGGSFLDSMYKRIRFTGYTPMGLYVSQTSFWQKSD